MAVGGQRLAPAAITPRESERERERERLGTHCIGGCVGSKEAKISPPSGFDPRTVQMLASPYTD